MTGAWLPRLASARTRTVDSVALGGPPIRLRIIEAEKPPVEYRFDRQEVVLGRSPECDVVVNHPYVSGRHLRIMAGVMVEDLGSSNGTFLDDRRLEGPEVLSGRQLTVGGPVIRLEVYADSGATATAPDAPEATQQELARLRARVAELEAQLARQAQAAAKPVPPTQSPSGAHSAQPNRSGPGAESQLLADLVRHDYKEFPAISDGSVTDFYILESFRMLRQMEKIVTRMAGELSTQLSLNTVLPDVDGNFLALFAEVLVDPASMTPREALVAYHAELRRWLYVSLGAYQRAAVKFGDEVRQTLSPMSLAQQGPIPATQRLLGRQDQVLWRRARAYLDELERKFVEGRVDELAKLAAREMLGK